MAAMHGEGKLIISFHADAGLGAGRFLDGFQQSLPVASSLRRAVKLAGFASGATIQMNSDDLHKNPSLLSSVKKVLLIFYHDRTKE
jgi:hypothetical protein